MPKPTEEQFSQLGRGVWEWMKKRGGDIFGEEDSETLMEIAEKSGLAERVKYNPEIHGTAECCDPGDEIWYFGGHE